MNFYGFRCFSIFLGFVKVVFKCMAQQMQGNFSDFRRFSVVLGFQIDFSDEFFSGFLQFSFVFFLFLFFKACGVADTGGR